MLDELKLTSPKTKEMINILSNLKLVDKKVLLIVKELDENVILASRNLENVILIEASEINVLDLVAANTVVVTEEALKAIEEVLV